MNAAGPSVSPAEAYAARLSGHDAQVARLARRDEWVGTTRLIAALLIVAVVATKLAPRSLSLWWILPPLLGFAGLLVWHGVVRRARSRALRAAAFYRRGLDRIGDAWMGGGNTGERFAAVPHVYAADLDLFGCGGLFELLCVVRTRMGEQTLAQWLLAPAAPAQILERHACVHDLRARLDLREDLHTAGNTEIGVQPDALLAWAESANQLREPWISVAAFVLPVLAIATALLWGLEGVRWPFLVVLVAEIVVFRILMKRLNSVAHATEGGFENLRSLSGLLARIERERFEEPALQAVQRQLASKAQPASALIGRLGVITEVAGQRDNLFVRVLFEIPLLYSVHLGLAAESWRSQHGLAVRGWLAAVAHLEALSSLAMYAYEHPADSFPQLAEGTAVFEARELGHPLVAAASCVRNDVSIRDPVRTLLVSGSNMSGKSTLLRAVGLNTVLAMAGAPVRATALRLTPLQVGASIRVNDSLQKGHSRFYAEISRLRELYELSAHGVPLLFLLDELLQGTNSKDRRIGAEGVLRAFMERGAIGLISTHDLALADIRGLHEGALRNVHFQECLDDGRMSFDFKLRNGIVTQSNGIELMRAIGLKV